LAKHEIADVIKPESLLPWLEGHADDVEAVLHMGASSTTTESDVDLIVARNVRATLDLVEWCTRARIRLIYASSAATYGDGTGGFGDDGGCASLAAFRPLNAYGWSKLVVDRRIARLAADARPLPPQCVGLRFFNVYGPNEYHKGAMRSVIAKSFADLQAGRPLRLFRSDRPEYPDGGQLRDFVYVRDCVDVIGWFLDNPVVSGLFNLGTGQARSWAELATALFAAMGREPRVEFIEMPENLRAKYQYFTEAPMAKLRSAGFVAPFTSLEAGVTDYVQLYLATPDPYR
jgi:ADP-L-glycero-D-manno-heptose 6-epimerase